MTAEGLEAKVKEHVESNKQRNTLFKPISPLKEQKCGSD